MWRKTERTKLEQAEKYLHTAQDTKDWDREKIKEDCGNIFYDKHQGPTIIKHSTE
jgi:hypothetical protein